jgi:hypothetical protein
MAHVDANAALPFELGEAPAHHSHLTLTVLALDDHRSFVIWKDFGRRILGADELAVFQEIANLPVSQLGRVECVHGRTLA